MKLFDRVAAGLDTLGRKANQALDEGKLRVDLARVRRRMDGAAQSLGYLTYRQAKGESAAPAEIESLTRRIAEGEAEVARIEAAIAEVKRRGASAPAPATAPGEAAPADQATQPAAEATPAAAEATPPEPPTS